jgi:hypothetical protein
VVPEYHFREFVYLPRVFQGHGRIKIGPAKGKDQLLFALRKKRITYCEGWYQFPLFPI